MSDELRQILRVLKDIEGYVRVVSYMIATAFSAGVVWLLFK